MNRSQTEFGEEKHFQVLFDGSDVCGRPTEFYQAGPAELWLVEGGQGVEQITWLFTWI